MSLLPWPVGPTHASNLKCYCGFHHLLKTFWCGVDGWREQQLPDGTLIVTAPTGHTYTTKPGSALEPKTSPNASKPNANSTTTTSPNATNPTVLAGAQNYGWYGTPTARNTYSGGTSNARDRRGSRISTSSGMASL